MPLPPSYKVDFETASLETLQNALSLCTPEEARTYLASLASLYDRATAGAVLTLDGRKGWLQYLRAGFCYGNAGLVAAVAAQQGMAQLWNPPGSGVRVLVAVAAGSPSVASDLFVLTDNAESAIALQGAPPSLVVGATAQAPSACHFRQGTVAAQPGGVGVIGRQFAAANVMSALAHSGEFLCELPEGAGLDVLDGAANDAFRFNLAWAEVPARLF